MALAERTHMVNNSSVTPAWTFEDNDFTRVLREAAERERAPSVTRWAGWKGPAFPSVVCLRAAKGGYYLKTRLMTSRTKPWTQRVQR